MKNKKCEKIRKTIMSIRPPGCKIQLEAANEIKNNQSNTSVKGNMAAGIDEQIRFIP